MNVERILEGKGRAVATIPPDANVAFAADKLSAMGIGALVVSSDGVHVEGVVSERALVRSLNKHGAGCSTSGSPTSCPREGRSARPATRSRRSWPT